MVFVADAYFCVRRSAACLSVDKDRDTSLGAQTMFEKAKPARDAFTFSLRGMKATAPFVAAPVIADDRINKMLGERIARGGEDSDQKPAPWLSFDFSKSL